MLKNVLFIINPQNDFCDRSGSLYIQNSETDINNICKIINNKYQYFDRICVTMDTHLMHHIATPNPWIDEQGNHPKPYTILDKNGIDQSTGIKYHSLIKSSANINYERFLMDHYKNNKNPMILWPTHCIIGTWGHNIPNNLHKSLYTSNNIPVWYHLKGHEVFREQYSGVEENNQLFNNVEGSVNIYICGEAKSHSVYETIKGILQFNILRDDRQLFVLTDCTSSVSGFEQQTNINYQKLADHNLLKLIKSTDI